MAYLMFIVNAHNQVRPCCKIYRGVTPKITHENIVGDLTVDGFRAIWNSPLMQTVRSKHRIAGLDYCRWCREM